MRATGKPELLADSAIGTLRSPQHRLGTGGRRRRQRDRTPRRQAFHQHAPAMAGLFGTTDDPINRDEDVLAPVRTVRKRSTIRQMAAADVHARMVRRDDGNRDAKIFALAERPSGSNRLEGQADQCRLRTKRDIALVPGESNAKRLDAVVRAALDERRYRAWWRHQSPTLVRSVRSMGTLFAVAPNAWQVVVLFARSVPYFLNQLTRPK